MDRKEARQKTAEAVAKLTWAFEPSPVTIPGQAPMYQVMAPTEDGRDLRTIALVTGADAADNARRIALLPDLLAKADALLVAFGGDVPSWLRNEASALEAAIATAHRAAVDETTDPDSGPFSYTDTYSRPMLGAEAGSAA